MKRHEKSSLNPYNETMSYPYNKEAAKSNESGNALWFILLAIALLAALTITISRSSDTVDQSGDVERRRVQATEIMSFAKSVEQAIDRLKSRGISENTLSFKVSYLSSDYQNTGCAGDESCLVFHKNGGGIAYEAPKTGWLDSAQSAQVHYGSWYIPEQVCVASVGRGGTTCNTDSINNEELVLVLPWIKRSLCVELNKLLDITNPGTPPVNSDDAFPAGYAVFDGAFSGDGGIILDGGSNLEGELSGCFAGNGAGSVPPSGTYHFYHVLIRR